MEWYQKTGPVTKGRYNPRCREDVVSRSVWVQNVVKGDEKLHRDYLRKMMKKMNPNLSTEQIEYYMAREER